MDAADPHQKEHGGAVFHAFELEAAGGRETGGHAVTEMDFHGWIGTDENKLVLKSEVEREEGTTESTELWALYSRNVDTFWDFQIGLRHDTEPRSFTYAAAGLSGLAPFFIETDIHFF